ncbi:LysR family transcriptional regulator [Elioraea tepida]|uniref:LysR family transcriptional regulator n=1 Tax=Elioraea tepida TaxID=2843330 RepID=A0A975YJ12_9PROT|nr:LysR family transcriptional regulator [Elioraea tepida]QXM23963.1 LysR family transcriptional regulator [Elioraea tepida]
MKRRGKGALPALHVRVDLVPGVSFGPGKADLLQGIAETGSIAAAGRRLGMSYKRAWSLVETLNRMFRAPLVSATKGGLSGGGAVLTPEGEAVLARYRAIQARVAAAAAEELAALHAAAADRR